MDHSHQAEEIAILSMALISASVYSLWLCRVSFLKLWIAKGESRGLRKLVCCLATIPLFLGIELVIAWLLRHDGSGLLELAGFALLVLAPIILLVPEIEAFSAWQEHRNNKIRVFSRNPGLFQSVILYICMYMVFVLAQHLILAYGAAV